tara:strand:+ start:271 stop:558 length:288 start_codon:yes stop_codon:yes gene_type:complete
MFDFWFLNLRLKAIKRSAIICEANPFSGEGSDGAFYSMKQIEQAMRNRKMNQHWFIRNLAKIKKKFSTEDYEQIAKDLGIDSTELIGIEIRVLEQ